MRAGLVTMAILPALILTACKHEKSAAEQAREDARDIAMVEAAQDAKPPPVPLDPQPITSVDIEQNKLYGAGCTLVPRTVPGGDPVVMANDRRAVMKVGGKFVTFAADAGAELLALGVRTHYVGKEQALFLDHQPGDGSKLGEEAMRWDGRLTVRDAHGQLVYTTSGELVCGG